MVVWITRRSRCSAGSCYEDQSWTPCSSNTLPTAASFPLWTSEISYWTRRRMLHWSMPRASSSPMNSMSGVRNGASKPTVYLNGFCTLVVFCAETELKQFDIIEHITNNRILTVKIQVHQIKQIYSCGGSHVTSHPSPHLPLGSLTSSHSPKTWDACDGDLGDCP